jgi:hypothetical protein
MAQANPQDTTSLFPFLPHPAQRWISAAPVKIHRRPSKPASKPRTQPERLLDPATLPDYYAMVCDGACLAPVVCDGAVVAISKTDKPRQGDFIAVWFRPEFVKPGEHQVIFKRMFLDLPGIVEGFPYEGSPNPDAAMPALVIEMFNPEKKFPIPCNMVMAIHKAVGLLPAPKGSGGTHSFRAVRPFPERVTVSHG